MIQAVKLAMCLKLMFHDVEDDGQHNYLARQPRSATQIEYYVAFNSPKDVDWKDGCYQVEASCEMGAKALDPPIPGDESSWGYPRTAPVCNAKTIERQGWRWEESSSTSTSATESRS